MLMGSSSLCGLRRKVRGERQFPYVNLKILARSYLQLRRIDRAYFSYRGQCDIDVQYAEQKDADKERALD